MMGGMGGMGGMGQGPEAFRPWRSEPYLSSEVT